VKKYEHKRRRAETAAELNRQSFLSLPQKIFNAPMLLLAAAIRVALAADEPSRPTATSFVTEIPTIAPDGYDDGYGGAVLIAFLVGLVGLGLSIVGTIFVIAPLVETHEHKDDILADLDQFDIEGFGEE
jgi:hypothetical protein